MTAMQANETARVLAEFGSPDQRLDYAVMCARHDWERARQAARAAYMAAGGGGLDQARDQRGEPLYDALVSAIQDAAAEYRRAFDEATAAYRAETGQS
jgi:hypothetical protein